MANRRQPLDRLIGLAIGVPALLAGVVGAAWGTRAFLGGASQRMWEARQCWVEDVHVAEIEPWRGQIYFRGQFEVTFDLRELESGKLFRAMPAAPNRPRYHDAYEVNGEVLPATPGALVDCWLNPTGTRAYLRRTPMFMLGFYVIGTLFALVFALFGVICLRPDTADRIGEYVEARFGNQFDLFY